MQGNPGRRIRRIAKYAATDGRERERMQAVFPGQANAFAIAGGKQFRFALVAALAYRPHGVDDMVCGKRKTRRDACLARRATHAGSNFRQRPACAQQLRARGAMDGTIDSAAAEQGFIGCVDDGIRSLGGDVGFDDSQHEQTIRQVCGAAKRHRTGNQRQGHWAARSWMARMQETKQHFPACLRGRRRVRGVIRRNHAPAGSFRVETAGSGCAGWPVGWGVLEKYLPRT